jgi:hypothetical protein
VPHISLVFREMWDTAGLPLKPVTGASMCGRCGGERRGFLEQNQNNYANVPHSAISCAGDYSDMMRIHRQEHRFAAIGILSPHLLWTQT